MDLKDALKCINSGQYIEAAGYMLDEAFKGDIHKLTQKQLRAWEVKAAKALELSHKQLKQICNDEPAGDLAWQAYEEAWEKLGFAQSDRAIEI